MSDPGAAPRLDRRWLWALAVLVCFGRLPAALSAPVVSVDESSYVLLARAAPSHPSVLLAHNYHPLYPTVLAPAVWLGGETGGRLWSVALALLAAWCVFGLARERFESRAAAGAVLLFACLPGAVEGGAKLLSEAVYVPALLGSVWALVRAARTGSVGAAAVGGVCAGAAYLARLEGLAPALAGAAALALLAAWDSGAPAVRPGRRLAQAAATVAGCAVVALPYMVAIGGMSRKKRIGAWDAAFQHAGASELLQSIIPKWIGTADVGSSERAPVIEFFHEWFVGASPLLVAVLCVGLAILVARRLRPRRADGVPGAVLAVYVAAHVWLLWKAGYLSSRHVWPAALLTLPWAGRTLEAMRAWRPERWPAAGAALSGLVVALAVAAGATAAAWPWRARRPYLRDAGLELRGLVQAGDGIAAPDMRVPYYAGARPFIIGRTSWPEVRSRCAAEHVRFIAAPAAVLEARIRGWRDRPPESTSLVSEYPISSSADGRAETFVVYRLEP